MKNLILLSFLFCVAAVADTPQQAWTLTVNEPTVLVSIDSKGVVTINGDVRSRAFWDKVAAGFKEDCSNSGPHPNGAIFVPGDSMIWPPEAHKNYWNPN